MSYSFSWNSQAEQEIYTPPGTPRSRSLTRFTIRVGLPHFGQSVLFEVSITFLRSAVLAILAIKISSYLSALSAAAANSFAIGAAGSENIARAFSSRFPGKPARIDSHTGNSGQRGRAGMEGMAQKDLELAA